MRCNSNNVYGKRSFLSKESDTKNLQSIYFACDVGIISSYSNRICNANNRHCHDCATHGQPETKKTGDVAATLVFVCTGD